MVFIGEWGEKWEEKKLEKGGEEKNTVQQNLRAKGIYDSL